MTPSHCLPSGDRLRLLVAAATLLASSAATADFVRWSASVIAGDSIPVDFQSIVSPGDPVTLTVWIDLAAAGLHADDPNRATYQLAQVRGQVGSYSFDDAKVKELWIDRGPAFSDMQVTVVLTSPPAGNGFFVGQFAFELIGGPDMLEGDGVPTGVSEFSIGIFDVEACHDGRLSCGVPVTFLSPDSGSNWVTAEIVSALTPVPVPPVAWLLVPMLLSMQGVRAKNGYF